MPPPPRAIISGRALGSPVAISKMLHLAAVWIALAMLLVEAAASSEKPNAVVPGEYQPWIDITAQKHQRTVLESDVIFVVLFTDTSSQSKCSQCFDFQHTTFAKMANELNAAMDFAVSDAATQSGREFIAKYWRIDDELQ